MSRRTSKSQKRTGFINGRLIGRNPSTLTPEAYDLSECETYKTLAEAITDLTIRVQQTPAIAPYLQTLLCEMDADGSITNYTPVRSGAVVQSILSAQNTHE